jgi:hypothetical protein
MPELLVVIGVIVLFMSVGFPAYRHLQERSKVKATETLVTSVATVLAGQPLTAQVPSASANGRPTAAASMVAIPLWDVNADGVLDGNIAVGAVAGAAGSDRVTVGDRPLYARFASDDNLAAALEAAKYSGFARTTGFQVAAKALNAKGQVVDPWGTPLRYVYAPLLRVSAAASTVDIDTSFLVTPATNAAIAAKQAAIAGEVGGTRFGVWSAGPDKTDNTPDDIATFP